MKAKALFSIRAHLLVFVDDRAVNGNLDNCKTQNTVGNRAFYDFRAETNVRTILQTTYFYLVSLDSVVKDARVKRFIRNALDGFSTKLSHRRLACPIEAKAGGDNDDIRSKREESR